MPATESELCAAMCRQLAADPRAEQARGGVASSAWLEASRMVEDPSQAAALAQVMAWQCEYFVNLNPKSVDNFP